MRYRWIGIWLTASTFVARAANAQNQLNAAMDSTLGKSAAALSMQRALPVLQRAVNAVTMRETGGVDALRSIISISTDRSMLRTSTGQGMHPGAPAIEHAVLLNRFDLRGARVFSLRDLEIDGGQMWSTGVFVTPSGGYDFNYANRTYRTGPAADYLGLRASTLRGELLMILRAALNRPESLRSLGMQTVRGRPADVISFADVDGTVVTLYVDRANGLPVRSEVLADDPTRGDQVIPIDYSDYRTVRAATGGRGASTGSFRLPFKTYQDGRGPERWENTIERIELNEAIADSLFTLPKGMVAATASPPVTKLADGVIAMPASAAIEFRDFVLVFEAYGSSALSDANLARIRAAFPGKPVRYVVSSHYHEDHLGGVRPYAAAGATFLTTSDAESRILRALSGRHVMRPDSFAVAPKRPAIQVIDRSRVIEDSTRRLELYQIGPTAHVDKILIGYLPKERILIEGDLLDMPDGKPAAGGEDTEELAKKIKELGLDVERLVPIHGSVGTARDLDAAVRMHRARSSCPQDLVQRVFCDFWSPR